MTRAVLVTGRATFLMAVVAKLLAVNALVVSTVTFSSNSVLAGAPLVKNLLLVL